MCPLVPLLSVVQTAMDQCHRKLLPTHDCPGYEKLAFVFDLSSCQMDRSSMESNSRGLRLSAIQLRAEFVHFFGGWHVMGTELFAEPYYTECSWGPSTGSCGKGWEIEALCVLLPIEKSKFVCCAVSLIVSKPLPKTILKAVSRFLLSKAGKLPVRCCKPPK